MTTLNAPWSPNVVEGVSKVLADTGKGLTGSEIDRLLHQLGIDDPSPSSTKWRRLNDALLTRQTRDHSANHVIAFIYAAMDPVRYRTNPSAFTARQDALNEVLVFAGLRLNNAGKLVTGATAKTLSEAAQHAKTLRAELNRRQVHYQVLRYCSQEILEGNPFHASLEAAKSIPDRIREMTGVNGDGAALIDAVMGIHHPRIAINTLQTKSEQDEHTGFANLCKGLLAMFRNPVAHDPRTSRSVSDAELLELLMIVSMVHRRLDSAVVLP
jgi:uncharacterized protein (TIGR02391 family)